MWRLDERAKAGVENLDPVHVARYDEKEGWDASPEVDGLVALGLGADSTVVDLGAGTGIFAVAAAQRFARVVAVDVSPPMLEHLRRRTAGIDNLEVVEAGFLTYEHAGAPADAVFSRWAFHHLPDFWKVVALRRIHDLLRPGGVLRLIDLVFSVEPNDVDHTIETWRRTLPETAREGDWVRSDIDDHVRDEHSTFTWLLEPMLTRAGFEIEAATYPSKTEATYTARRVK